ncbi:hypothetical protein J3E74DRAFT_266404, partial [Bipolaris maydis]
MSTDHCRPLEAINAFIKNRRGTFFEAELFAALFSCPVIRSFEFALADGALLATRGAQPLRGSYTERFWRLNEEVRAARGSQEHWARILVLFDVKSSISGFAEDQIYITSTKQQARIGIYIATCAANPNFVEIIPNRFSNSSLATQPNRKVAVNASRKSILPPSAYARIRDAIDLDFELVNLQPQLADFKFLTSGLYKRTQRRQLFVQYKIDGLYRSPASPLTKVAIGRNQRDTFKPYWIAMDSDGAWVKAVYEIIQRTPEPRLPGKRPHRPLGKSSQPDTRMNASTIRQPSLLQTEVFFGNVFFTVMDQCAARRSGLVIVLSAVHPMGDLAYCRYNWTKQEQEAFIMHKKVPCTITELPRET